MSVDYGQLAQEAAEKHLAACYEALWWDEEEQPGPAPGSPAIAPFCGCDTCVVREVLYAGWAHLQQIETL